jgi:hypothetical protein
VPGTGCLVPGVWCLGSGVIVEGGKVTALWRQGTSFNARSLASSTQVHSRTQSRPSSSINARDSAKEFLTLTSWPAQDPVSSLKTFFHSGNQDLCCRFRKKARCLRQRAGEGIKNFSANPAPLRETHMTWCRMAIKLCALCVKNSALVPYGHNPKPFNSITRNLPPSLLLELWWTGGGLPILHTTKTFARGAPKPWRRRELERLLR